MHGPINDHVHKCVNVVVYRPAQKLSFSKKEAQSLVCPQCGTQNPNEGQAQCVRCKKPLHSAALAGKIVCANHGNREATTGCAACGKRLCSVCAVSASGVDFCEDCAPASATRVVHDEDYEAIPIIDPAKGEKAGFGPRLTGWAIDAALFAAVIIVLAVVIWPITGSLDFMTRANVGNTAGYWVFRILIVLSVLIYNAVMTAMTGQTLGRRVAGVMVLNDKGYVVSLQASVLRTLMSVVSFLPLGLGFWWAIWDKNGETWHDKIVHTTAYRWEEVA